MNREFFDFWLIRIWFFLTSGSLIYKLIPWNVKLLCRFNVILKMGYRLCPTGKLHLDMQHNYKIIWATESHYINRNFFHFLYALIISQTQSLSTSKHLSNCSSFHPRLTRSFTVLLDQIIHLYLTIFMHILLTFISYT